MTHGNYPLVTLAIPLYHSQQFVERIVQNITAMRYPNLEIIISDRHSADETVELLQKRFANDTRFRFIKATDALSWVEHYNALLKTATGQYFLWMPHDDIYPSTYISSLVAALEKEPNAVIASGSVELVTDKGDSIHRFADPPLYPGGVPNQPLRMALHLLIFWENWILFRGVFRRDVVLQAGLLIRPSYRLLHADTYWIFGLMLRGAALYRPGCLVRKNKHAASATKLSWHGAPFYAKLYRIMNGCVMLIGYLCHAPVTRSEKISASLLIIFWSIYECMMLLYLSLQQRFPRAVPKGAWQTLWAPLKERIKKHVTQQT